MKNSDFDFIVRSTILRGEKANKGLEAIAAPTPHQMNRLIGCLADGTKVVIASRPGKGGMDFTKLLGGKVYAVAADGVSPVFEKDGAGAATKTPKLEDGLPLYSSSGFYLLSSKEYPALELGEYFTLLCENGAQVLMVSDAELAAAQRFDLTSDLDLDLLAGPVCEALADSNNLVTRFDADINRKRRRGVERAAADAEDAGEAYQGVAFKELSASKKDGNPALVAYWREAGQPVQSALILREKQILNSAERWMTEYLSPEAAWELFLQSDAGQGMVRALGEGVSVSFGFSLAHVMRTSISFRRKVENFMDAPPGKPQYGDAVYIQGALKGWCRGIVAIMQSQHPQFPAADYDAHHYVAAPRQAEVGMNKREGGQGWFPPETVCVDLLSAAVPL